MDLQAAAPSPTPTRRTPRRAADRAPPRPRPPARALVAGLQTSPRCRRELRTSPGCRPRRASRPRTRYKGLMKRPLACVSTVLLGTSHILRNILRRILRHVLHVQRGRRRACVGPEVSRRWKTTRHDEDRHASFAAPKTPSAKSCTKSYATSFTCSSFTCRPRAVAKARGRCLENRPWACRINNGFKEHCATMKKPFAWGLAGCARDQPCASWVSKLPTSRLNDRRLGLALVVQRSGQVRGSAHA